MISRFTNSENTASPIKRSDFHNAIIQYEIARIEVESLVIGRLLRDLRQTPDNPMINAGPGCCLFWVSDYDDDARELCQTISGLSGASQGPNSTWMRRSAISRKMSSSVSSFHPRNGF